MFVTELSVGEFLRQPFGSVRDGGFAGLVFLIARTADAPDLHERFFREWSDLHDLTGRYLAVITPAPGGSTMIRKGGRYGTAVRNVAILGDKKRLNPRFSRPSIRMASGRPEARTDWTRTARAPRLIRSLPEHKFALTTVVGEMQEFFGISESLVPCAVVVSLQEKAEFAVTITKDITVYQLLKLIKTEIEPETARISQKQVELAAAKAAWRNQHIPGDLLDRYRRAAQSVHQEWSEHRARLSQDLADISDKWGGEQAAMSRWMSGRVGLDEPLTADERVRTRALLHELETARTFGRIPRRLRRTVAKLNSNYPEGHPALVRLAAASTEEAVAKGRVAQLKADLDNLKDNLHLGAAVTAAARQLGFEATDGQGLLAWRELEWPVTVLARPTRNVPGLRIRRA